MNEYLVKAIIRLFAIVVKGNVTEESWDRVKFIVHRQANAEDASEFLRIFEEFTRSDGKDQIKAHSKGSKEMDASLEEFVEEWANIMLICKRINLESTLFQKIVVILRVIELSHDSGRLTERQDNFIYYIGKALNIDNKIVERIKSFVFGQSVEELKARNVLIIDDKDKADYRPAEHMRREGLHGFLAFLHIPEIEGYFVKYIGNSPILLNGLAFRPRFIYIFAPGSNIRGGKIAPIYYSDVVAQFKEVGRVNKIKLTAEDIWVRFKQERIGLRDIYLSEESGNLVGIMGASGAGKSTLLETLIGKIKPKTGTVLINGIDVHKAPEKLKGLIGYVPQDDLLMADLTVYENLFFAGKLCFADYEDEKIHDIVINTLRTLGILDIKDLAVGSPLKKTISGGQRKRLNIALELLREPAILFLDEPTSGLSSRDSENIMTLLKELALKGKLIITTIHQPSSDIFKMFDNLIILDVGGYQIYYGDPVASIVYFRDIVNMIQRDQGACITCGTVKVEQIFDIIEAKVVNEYGKFTDRRRLSPKAWSDHFKKRLLPKIRNEKSPLPATTFRIPPWTDQFKVFVKRDVLGKLRNMQYLVVTFAEAPLLGLIIGYFVRYYNPADDNQLGYTFANNPNIPYYFLMSIIVALFVGLSLSGEEIIKDRLILQRERFLNLSHSSYLTSKVIIMFGISAIQTLTFVLVGNYLLEFKGMYFSFWFLLFTTACVANLVGLIISSAFDSVITVYIMVPVILIPQLMFNGVGIEFDRLNPQISSADRVPMLGELMVSRWGFEAIAVRAFKDNEYEKHFYEYEKVIANADYKTAYYLKELETSLAACLAALRGEVPREEIEDDLDLLKYELHKELTAFGKENTVSWDKLTPALFDSATYYTLNERIVTLKKVYLNRKDKAFRERQEFVRKYILEPKKEDLYFQIKNAYYNEKLASIVKNIGLVAILKIKNRLIRKINPIYATPEEPDNPLNFRTYLYAPEKYFAGTYHDTFWFNITVMWVMALIGLLMLYADLLKKFLMLLGRIGDYKFRQKLKKQA